MDHRGAHFPRLWPMLAESWAYAVAISLVVTFAIGVTGWYAGAVTGLAVATWVFNFRLWRWRRKHPVKPPEQIYAETIARIEHHIETQREVAPWQ